MARIMGEAVMVAIGPSKLPRRLWYLRALLDPQTQWMIKYIRRGDENKAKQKAIEAVRLGRQLLAGVEQAGLVSNG